METVLFGSFTVGEVLRYAGFALAGIVVLVAVVRLFGGSKTKGHVQTVQCTACGWKGQVSRYAGRCPRCSNTLGEQRAKKQTR